MIPCQNYFNSLLLVLCILACPLPQSTTHITVIIRKQICYAINLPKAFQWPIIAMRMGSLPIAWPIRPCLSPSSSPVSYWTSLLLLHKAPDHTLLPPSLNKAHSGLQAFLYAVPSNWIPLPYLLHMSCLTISLSFTSLLKHPFSRELFNGGSRFLISKTRWWAWTTIYFTIYDFTDKSLDLLISWFIS